MSLKQLINPPAIIAPAPAGSIQSITSEIKTLYADVASRARLLKEDRIKIGQLLIALREKFGVKNQTGKKFASGKTGGSFCAHLQANGLNLGTCYDYIAMAEGRQTGATVVRVQFWQTFNKQMKKSTERQKVALLKKAVAHIVKLYGVKATVIVSVQEPK
jgi:hypothetical protein